MPPRAPCGAHRSIQTIHTDRLIAAGVIVPFVAPDEGGWTRYDLIHNPDGPETPPEALEAPPAPSIFARTCEARLATLRGLLADFLIRVEGERLTAYLDSVGVWTIGVGHTGPDVRKGLSISHEESRRLLLIDLESALDAVLSHVAVELTDNQCVALASFTFNVGLTAFRTSTLLRLLNAGDKDAVIPQLRRWVKGTVDGKPITITGLVNRREAEITLWSTP